MNSEEQQYLIELENALRIEQSKSAQLQQSASSVFVGQEDGNLIEFQLELDNILERIDHLLRGHVLKFDGKGNLIWQEQRDKRYELFNEYGVQEILRILSIYLNRNTILSNYDEDTIKWKVYDLGCELTDLIFMKYEEMGLDSSEKRKLYPIIVKEIVDTIHSSYLRALGGLERESLRTARTVTQTEPLGSMRSFGIQDNPSQNKRSWLKPTTWFKT